VVGDFGFHGSAGVEIQDSDMGFCLSLEEPKAPNPEDFAEEERESIDILCLASTTYCLWLFCVRDYIRMA
jgi:hypothetical protein